MSEAMDFKLVQENKSNSWMVIGDHVYDLSRFKHEHPGGPQYIEDHAGTDATEAFMEAHPVDIIDRTITGENLMFAKKGPVDKKTVVKGEKKPLHGAAPVAPVEGKPPLEAVINVFDFEKIAQVEMLGNNKREGWDYYSSGGDDELTLRENHNAFHRIWMKPRVMVNVKEVDTRTSILGTQSSFPVYLSAVAMCGLGHEDGELAWVRAAGVKKVPFMMPSLASTGFADMCGARIEGQVLYFQLYVNPNREVAKRMVQTAEAAGVQTLFITCDAPQLGNREKDRRNKATKAAAVQTKESAAGVNSTRDASQGVSKALSSFIDPALCWDDLKWFRSITNMKICLKGIQCAEDALLAVEHGVDGIVCSNHGGRQLDTARSGVEVLPEVMGALREKGYENQIEVFVDGGVRRGTDVFKCIALGAKAVGLGRPALYAMAAYGQAGVEKMLDLLRAEFEMAMRLSGCRSLADITSQRVIIDNLKDHIAMVPQDNLYNGVYIPPGLPDYGKAVAAAVRADIEAEMAKKEDAAPNAAVDLAKGLFSTLGKTIFGANATTTLMRSAAMFIFFLFAHTFSNALLLVGPEAYHPWVAMIHNNPLRPVIEMYLGLATVVHAVVGLYLTVIYGRYSSLKTGKLFFSSLVILGFLLQHVMTFRFDDAFNAKADKFASIQKHFDDTEEVGLYVLAAAAIGYHLHYGWPKAVRKMGLPTASQEPVAALGQALVYASCSVMAFVPVYLHTLGVPAAAATVSEL
eukprot:TRINITY_DN6635_c0_g1_i2.p1 TRINITY_DN6635_c0_g1~~TRINITY_DN6635_c0_g1_i2.p1  ORF type:complete len:746 (+),score=302.57 TRINITY_DN6635_c0_g1_i2:73-2310(+)